MTQAFISRWSSTGWATALSVFWQWWSAQLIGCLPKAWQQSLATSKQGVLLRWRGNESIEAVVAEARHAEVVSGQTHLQHILVLPAGAVLTAPVQLPKAAARDLQAVMNFEMDKFTPFKAEQVYFAAQPNVDARSPATLSINLVVILRERLDDILQALKRQGYEPDRVDVQSASGQTLGINLLPETHDSYGRRPRHRLTTSLALLTAGLALTAMLLYVHNRQSALEHMRAHVQALRSEAMQIQALRQQLNDAQEAGQFVAARKKSAPETGALLSELSTCIPATTWLEQLEIKAQGEVTFNGQSTQASALIGAMKQCTSLVNPEFQGMIQTDAATGKERFSMLAQLRHKEVERAPAETP